jgi:phage host-nuclease inhibitor protein Gam
MAKAPLDIEPEKSAGWASKEQMRGDPIDEAGQALVAMVRQAKQLATKATDHAAGFADQTAAQLRAVEDRIKELEREIVHYRTRAENAEMWLQNIQNEIKNILLKR